jgi:hypothetical protein
VSQAVKVALLADQFAAEDGENLVDTIGELIAAILNMDRSLAQRHVLAVNICNA